MTIEENQYNAKNEKLSKTLVKYILFRKKFQRPFLLWLSICLTYLVTWFVLIQLLFNGH